MYSRIKKSGESMNKSQVDYICGVGTCLSCGKTLSFNKKLNSYPKYCGTCFNKQPENKKRLSNSIKKTWDDPEKRKERLKKTKDTYLEKYGVEHNMKLEKNKKYFSDLHKNFSKERKKEINEKRAKTNLKKYGVDNIFKDTERMKKAYLKKLGVDHPAKDPKIKEKILKKLHSEEVLKKNIGKNGNVPKKFYNNELHYQGSYELDLIKYVEKNGCLDKLKNGKTFTYKDKEGKERFYFPDFTLENENEEIVIEVKSNYTKEKDKNLNLKQEAVVENKNDFLLVVDKKYEDLDKYLNKCKNNSVQKVE